MTKRLNEGQVALIRELIAAAIDEQLHASAATTVPSTAQVLAALVEHGNQLGYFTVGPGSGARWPSWVCDVCWLSLGPGGSLDGVALVVESEWGSGGDHHDDFAKLMVVRAELRVMLCLVQDAGELADLAAELHRTRAGYGSASPDDRYLLAAYLVAERRMRFAEARGVSAWGWQA
jgi:hypothetical protein